MNAFMILFAAIAVRNPFWPIGWEGVREPIQADPVVEVTAPAETAADDTATAAAAAELAKNSEKVSNRSWKEAQALLKVTGTAVVTGKLGERRESLIINGRTYGYGDLISVNSDSMRFTWRIREVTKNGTLKLARVRVKKLEEKEGIAK